MDRHSPPTPTENPPSSISERMGGSDWKSFCQPSKVVRSVALMGPSGNGKSATGNSILGEKLFKSISNSAGVTTTSELQTRAFDDVLTLHVIDTPGFLASSATPDFVGKEVVKCIHMAQIHAILVVFSLRNRFNDEDESVLPKLKALFGEHVCKHMVVVFTGGDDLEENEETLDQYLARTGGSQSLQEILQLSQNRKVVFNNRTRDEKKKSEQIEQLLSMVNKVLDLNAGRSFTDMVLEEMKRDQEFSDLKEEIKRTLIERIKSLEQQLGETTANFKEEIKSLKKELGEETAARLQAERVREEQVKTWRREDEKRHKRWLHEQRHKNKSDAVFCDEY